MPMARRMQLTVFLLAWLIAGTHFAYSLALQTAGRTVEVKSVMEPGELPDMTLGNPDAPAKLVIYTGISPFEAKFHLHVIPVIQRKYIDTGQLLLIVRERASNEYTQLARCAPPEDYFKVWRVIHASVADEWSRYGDPARAEGERELAQPDEEIFRELRRKAGISDAGYRACLETPAISEGLWWEEQRAESLGKQAGTLYFLNGEPLRVFVGAAGKLDEQITLTGIQIDMAIQRILKTAVDEQEASDLHKDYEVK